MKKIVTVLVALLTASAMFAFQNTDPENLNTSFSAMKSLFLPAIAGQILILLADARKHFGTPEWSWKTFFDTKTKPFLVTTIGGIVIYAIISYFPFTKKFIETLAGSELTEVTAASFFGLASGIIDGFLKKKA